MMTTNPKKKSRRGSKKSNHSLIDKNSKLSNSMVDKNSKLSNSMVDKNSKCGNNDSEYNSGRSKSAVFRKKKKDG